jgi:hypothetical protein
LRLGPLDIACGAIPIGFQFAMLALLIGLREIGSGAEAVEFSTAVVGSISGASERGAQLIGAAHLRRSTRLITLGGNGSDG